MTDSARLRQPLVEVVAPFTSPDIHTTIPVVGPLSVIEPPLAHQTETVMREAVSNAGDLTGSGLRNLSKRAQQAAEEFTHTDAEGGSTVLRWSGPLS